LAKDGVGSKDALMQFAASLSYNHAKTTAQRTLQAMLGMPQLAQNGRQTATHFCSVSNTRHRIRIAIRQ